MLPNTTMSATVNGNHFPALAQRPVERQVVQHIVAIDVARVRFPADALVVCVGEAGTQKTSPVQAVRDTGDTLR